MQLTEIKERMNQLNQAWEELKSTNEARLSQVENKGSPDTLTMSKLNKINNVLDEYKSRVQKFEVSNNRPSIAVGTSTLEVKPGRPFSCLTDIFSISI